MTDCSAPAHAFEEIQCAMANGVGSAEVAGAILAVSLSITIIIALIWILGQESSKDVMFFGGIFGLVLSVVFSWLEIWILFVLILLGLIAWLRPWESGGE